MTTTETGHIRKYEHAVLVGTLTQSQQRWDREEVMNELARLTETAGGQVIQSMIQTIQRPDPATFIGTGKVEEIHALCQQHAVDIVIFNDPLSPVQQKNLETAFGCKVIDRTALILDIFAQRAKTREGKMQVELAQLQYMLPRLTRMWTHLSRLGGGIGTRGPGETQLETDKRRIRTRIAHMKKELKEIIQHRSQHRRARKSVPVPIVALIGYTNCGKSTLFRRMTGAETLIEDKLFATLDPLVRSLSLPNRQKVVVLDTVGFIRELPTQLVAAFRATLEEIASADLLLHIIDINDQQVKQQMETVGHILADLGIEHYPQVKVFNKIDQLDNPDALLEKNSPDNDYLYISALEGLGIDHLEAAIVRKIQGFRTTLRLTVPYQNKEATGFIHQHGTIIKATYLDTAVEIEVELDQVKADRLQQMLRA